MTTKQLTALALKIFAIYVFVEFLFALPQLFVAFESTRKLNPSDDVGWAYILAGAFLFVAILAVAYYVWRLAERLLTQMNPDDSNDGFPDPEGFILSVLGLFLIVRALVALIYSSTGLYVQAIDPDNPDGISAESVAYVLAYMIQLVIGATLVIRARGWVRMLRRLRQMGLHD